MVTVGVCGLSGSSLAAFPPEAGLAQAGPVSPELERREACASVFLGLTHRAGVVGGSRQCASTQLWSQTGAA